MLLIEATGNLGSGIRLNLKRNITAMGCFHGCPQALDYNSFQPEVCSGAIEAANHVRSSYSKPQIQHGKGFNVPCNTLDPALKSLS